ncbi:uncharacterized protein [Patagioenas fasciata]|uniref:uncharacterized protein isoform X2 n=1 Tax=Patagioenas fasciata TaxID=372321 RepID=UPI003A99C1A0
MWSQHSSAAVTIHLRMPLAFDLNYREDANLCIFILKEKEDFNVFRLALTSETAEIMLPWERSPESFASLLHFAHLVGLSTPRHTFLTLSGVGGCHGAGGESAEPQIIQEARTELWRMMARGRGSLPPYYSRLLRVLLSQKLMRFLGVWSWSAWGISLKNRENQRAFQDCSEAMNLCRSLLYAEESMMVAESQTISAWCLTHATWHVCLFLQRM